MSGTHNKDRANTKPGGMKIDLSKPIRCSGGWMDKHGRVSLWETVGVMGWQG